MLMTSLSYLHREEQIKEQVKMQSAKGKAKGGFTFAFCTLRFAFCLFLWGCHSECSEESRSALTLPALKVT